MNTPETSPATLKRRFEYECPDAPVKRQLFAHDDEEDNINNHFVENNNPVIINIIENNNILNENMNVIDNRDLGEQMGGLIELIELQIGLLERDIRVKHWKVRSNSRQLLHNVQHIKDMYEWNVKWQNYHIFNDFDEKKAKFRKAFERFNNEFFEDPKYAMPEL
jgi:hypothetical protein